MWYIQPGLLKFSYNNLLYIHFLFSSVIERNSVKVKDVGVNPTTENKVWHTWYEIYKWSIMDGFNAFVRLALVAGIVIFLCMTVLKAIQ